MSGCTVVQAVATIRRLTFSLSSLIVLVIVNQLLVTPFLSDRHVIIQGYGFSDQVPPFLLNTHFTRSVSASSAFWHQAMQYLQGLHLVFSSHVL